MPQVALKILKALLKESEKEGKKILDWKFVLEKVHKTVKDGYVLKGQDIFLMCHLMNDLGLVSSYLHLLKSLCFSWLTALRMNQFPVYNVAMIFCLGSWDSAEC